MKKVQNSDTNIPKDIKEFIRKQANFEAKFAKEMNDMKKHCIGFEKGFYKQTTEYQRIIKELSVANKITKKQQKEIDRLKQDFRNFSS